MSVEYVKNVMIDGDTNPYPGGAGAYESMVRTVLDTLKGTQTGQTVLGFFALRSHRVWIMPPDGLASRRTAGAGAVDATELGQTEQEQMARKINRLNARRVATIKDCGRHADGGGLYLSISPNGGRRWVFLFRWHGKPTEIGLGSARDVPLARARELAATARAKLAEGISPKEAFRHSSEDATFGECADRVIEAMRPGWRNAKHAAQWVMTLRDYAAPLRRVPVDQVATDDVLAVLKPLWNARPATASRLRQRIERVLDAAKAQGLRGGENPARWRGHLEQLLSKRQQLSRKHHAAMSYADVPAFMAASRQLDGTAARALEFLVLVAARSGEVLAARYGEFDLNGAIWTIPASRMKSGREHRVPLSERALEIVKAMHDNRSGDFVFAGSRPGRPMAANALERALLRMKVANATVHGFRSSFRDWCGDCTPFPREVVEAALAHAVGDQTEAAYRRGTAIEKRRKLMDAWAAFIGTSRAGAVIPINAGRNGAISRQNVSAG
jgi:integrase